MANVRKFEEQVKVRFTADQMVRLRQLAEAHQSTLTAVVRAMVDVGLASLDKTPGK